MKVSGISAQTKYIAAYFRFVFVQTSTRIFHQFLTQFLTIACVSESQNGDCKSYISVLDTEIFNQTLFIMEQNNVLAELCSASINQLIINSELIHDQILKGLLKGDFIYYIINKKKDE